MINGDSEKQVAAALGISGETVHVHAKTLYRRLNVAGRIEMMALAVRAANASIPSSRPWRFGTTSG